MNETIQLLQDVVRNARTGRDAVEQLLNKAEGGPMRQELNKEKAAYLQTQREGERALAVRILSNLSEMKLDNLGFDAAPYETLLQAEGISSVAVKIKHLRIEVAYFK